MNKLSDLPITIIESIPPEPFKDGQMVSVDIEMFKMDKKRMHRPTGFFASLALTWDAETCYVITDKDDLPKLEPIFFTNKPTLVFHNAPFDVFHLRRYMQFPAQYPNFHDTMLFEKILYNGMFDRVGLKHLVRRHLNLYMSKEARDEFSTSETLTNEMIRYNGYDAIATLLVAYEQLEKAKKSDMRIWQECDLPAMWAFMDFKGPKIDVDRWNEIADHNTNEADGQFGEFPFNPRSPAQVLKHLQDVEGLPIQSTGVKALEEHKKNPVVAKLLSYRKVEKKRSAYGYKWTDQHVEEDGRVHPSINVIGASTGRTSTDSPSIQNIPVRETPVFRECFIADDDCILVGADYSAQEPRISAFLSRDTTLISLFNKGGDIYSNVASFILQRPITKADPERGEFKEIVLGLIYGMSEFGLSAKLNITKEAAREKREEFFRAFPGVKMYVDHADTLQDYTKTILGRRVWLNPINQKARRNAKNNPIQGTAADMFKLAVVNLWERWDRSLEPFPAILDVHDELVIEVLKVNLEYAKQTLGECMVDAHNRLIPTVPAVVEVKTGMNWKEIH